MHKMIRANGFTSDYTDEVTQTQIKVGEGGPWKPRKTAPAPQSLPVEVTVRTGRPGPSADRPLRARRSAF